MSSFLNSRDPGIVVKGPRQQLICHQPRRSQDLGWPQNHPEKSSNFKPVSRATKIKKIGPKATQNHEKSTPESWEIQFLQKSIFTIHALPNACFCNPRHPNLDSKMSRKSNLEIDMILFCFLVQKYPNKLSKWVPKISEKSIKSRPGPLRVLPCAL